MVYLSTLIILVFTNLKMLACVDPIFGKFLYLSANQLIAELTASCETNSAYAARGPNRKFLKIKGKR